MSVQEWVPKTHTGTRSLKKEFDATVSRKSCMPARLGPRAATRHEDIGRPAQRRRLSGPCEDPAQGVTMVIRDDNRPETEAWGGIPSVPPGGHRLPPLPYAYNALEPYISEAQLRIHHDRHHAGYVEGLNTAELALVDERARMDFSLVRYWERELAFNGSGHILHSMYWTNMSPSGGGDPIGLVRDHIVAYFGSVRTFREQFSRAALDVEGSGWGVLVWQPQWGRLEILTAWRHEDLTQWGTIPVLVVDVWEHAYYLDYQNRRADYIKAWWNVVNWPDVERRLRLATEEYVPLHWQSAPGRLPSPPPFPPPSHPS